MTVTYTSHVATCRGFGCFWKLLFRWKGSIYKLIWPELLVYTTLYYICSLVYRLALNEEQRRLFEKISIFCQYFSDLIPLSFVLGFYVSIVVQRWWDQYLSLPWPDSLALFVSTSIHGQDERSRLMRRTVMRYVNLSQTITLIMISPRVKKRFPTLDHLVEAGFMTSCEKKIFDDLDEKTSHPKYWMPLVWAGSIVARARKEGRIRDDFAVKTILDEINRLRGLCGGLLSYDWISIPLVYTQVVTLAVYSFFLATVMGRQFLDPMKKIPNHHVDFYIPIFTFLQFFFFMGWLKVAETLVNPFGEDDDDFEVNWLVDRNLQVSYLIVDEMHNEHPDLIQDIYWDEVFPQELPYTIASEAFRREPPQGSTANIEVPDAEQEFLPMLEEEDEDEGIHESLSGINTDLETGSTKAIDIMKRRTSRSSGGDFASSQHLSSRKHSVLSFLLSKVTSGSNDNFPRQGIRPNSSTASMRHVRRRGLMRSTSRVSSTSQVTCQSPESLARIPTTVTQDSAIFRMSDVSLNNAGHDEVTSPTEKTRTHSGDEDDQIQIKIKRRDRDGNIIDGGPSEELHCGPSRRVSHSSLSRRQKTNAPLAETMGDEMTSEEKMLLFLGEKNAYGEPPPVFHDNDFHEETSDNAQQKKRKVLSNLNLKGLSKMLGTHNAEGETPSVASQSKFRSQEYLYDAVPEEEHRHAFHHSHPSSPRIPSPTHHWSTPRDSNEHVVMPAKPCIKPSLSPIESDWSSVHNPHNKDVFIFPESLSKPSTSDGSVSGAAPDGNFPIYGSTDHHVTSKETLETIVEGPQEESSEGVSRECGECRKRMISESELEVIPESDYMVAQTEDSKLLQ